MAAASNPVAPKAEPAADENALRRSRPNQFNHWLR